MTSILFLIETIKRNQFRSNYLKKKKLFKFFSAVLEFRLNFEHFQKMMILIANVYPNLRTAKKAVR